MNNHIYTERLILRPMNIGDENALYLLNNDVSVMKYLGHPITSRSLNKQYLENLLDQYTTNGIGRWAVLHRETNEIMGWAGIKFIKDQTNGFVNYYDLGYRLMPHFWGQGYATEATKVWIEYAKTEMNINTLYATTHVDNVGSQKVLSKCGFDQQNRFVYILNDIPIDCFWFELIL